MSLSDRDFEKIAEKFRAKGPAMVQYLVYTVVKESMIRLEGLKLIKKLCESYMLMFPHRNDETVEKIYKIAVWLDDPYLQSQSFYLGLDVKTRSYLLTLLEQNVGLKLPTFEGKNIFDEAHPKTFFTLKNTFVWSCLPEVMRKVHEVLSKIDIYTIKVLEEKK